MPIYRFQAICNELEFNIPEVELPESLDELPGPLHKLVNRAELMMWADAAKKALTVPCTACGVKAKSFLHHPTLYGEPADGELPMYVDRADAVCGDARCTERANQIFEASMDESARLMGAPPPTQLIVCNHCNTRKESMLRCSRCKSVHYCNTECQKSDWKAHKHACGK